MFRHLPSKVFTAVTQHLQLAWLVAITVLAQTPHDLVHGLPRGLVLMEQITGQENHVDIPSLGQLHDFVEGLPAIVATNRVALIIADMIVSGHEYAYRIGSCRSF